MDNYVCINGTKTELDEKQVGKVRKMLGLKQRKLCEYRPGEVFQIGKQELVVLEQAGDTTAVICKGIYKDAVQFGANNNFDGSNAENVCQEFTSEIASVVGMENIITHTVDLTSDDGLKDYGKVRCRASLLTTERYRRYVEILDEFKPDTWWWLATPFSTKRHESDRLVKCVAPSGYFNDFHSYNYDLGVRPFCILKSNIFVS